MSPQADRIPHVRVGARDGVGRRFLVPQCLTLRRRETSRKYSVRPAAGVTGAGEAPPSARRRPDRVGAGGSAELSSRASSLKTMLKTEITQQIYSY